MDFKKLPTNAKQLLDEIVNAENPTQYLSKRFDAASHKEDEELRGIIRELREGGYIGILGWSGNKPYNVIVTNAARTYDERLAEYEAKKAAQKQPTYIINDNSVNIGKGSKISRSTIASKIEGSAPDTTAKKSFPERHPIIFNVAIGLFTGFILLFSFWEKIVKWIEGLL